MSLAKALGGRALQAVIVAFGAVSVTFLLVRVIPGDTGRQILGVNASPESVQALNEQLNLTDSLPAQYWQFMSGVVRGDLGQSLEDPSESVMGLITANIGTTLVLIGLSVVFSTVVGVLLGIWAATTRSRWVDTSVRAGTVLGLGTPPYFLAVLLILVVALQLGLAPAAGWAESYPERLEYLWLPTLIMSWGLLVPLIARTVRSRARATMQEQFVEAAVARGVPHRRLVLRHVLPNSALPAIILIGLNTGGLLAGTAIVETLFGLPGIGMVLLSGVESRDYPVVQGIAIVAGLFVVLCNMLAESAVRVIDPRTR